MMTSSLKVWLKKHSIQIHGLVLILMAVSSIMLYFAAIRADMMWMGLLLGLFVIANLFELMIP